MKASSNDDNILELLLTSLRNIKPQKCKKTTKNIIVNKCVIQVPRSHNIQLQHRAHYIFLVNKYTKVAHSSARTGPAASCNPGLLCASSIFCL